MTLQLHERVSRLIRRAADRGQSSHLLQRRVEKYIDGAMAHDNPTGEPMAGVAEELECECLDGLNYCDELIDQGLDAADPTVGAMQFHFEEILQLLKTLQQERKAKAFDPGWDCYAPPEPPVQWDADDHDA